MLFSACLTPANRRELTWKAEKPLRWKYFNKVDSINVSAGIEALSSVGLYYNYTSTSTYIAHTAPLQHHIYFDLDIYAKFFAEESKVLKTSTDDYVLKHEQMHFNISEIYARKFREIIVNSSGKLWSHEYFEAIYDSLVICENMDQVLYDKETLGASNRAQQAIWDEQILTRLDSLKAYENRKLKLYKSSGICTVTYNGKKYVR